MKGEKECRIPKKLKRSGSNKIKNGAIFLPFTGERLKHMSSKKLSTKRRNKLE